MKTRIAGIAAATVVGLASAFTLTAVAAPTPTPSPAGTPAPQATATATPGATSAPTQAEWGWPRATFRGRTMTVTNLKPGWNVYVTAANRATKKVYEFRAKATSRSAVIQLTGLPSGTYDIWIDAGDIPANESFYPGVKIKAAAGSQPGKAPVRDRTGGLAKTGV